MPEGTILLDFVTRFLFFRRRLKNRTSRRVFAERLPANSAAYLRSVCEQGKKIKRLAFPVFLPDLANVFILLEFLENLLTSGAGKKKLTKHFTTLMKNKYIPPLTSGYYLEISRYSDEIILGPRRKKNTTDSIEISKFNNVCKKSGNFTGMRNLILLSLGQCRSVQIL